MKSRQKHLIFATYRRDEAGIKSRDLGVGFENMAVVGLGNGGMPANHAWLRF
jgi:hypothetical protein